MTSLNCLKNSLISAWWLSYNTQFAHKAIQSTLRIEYIDISIHGNSFIYFFLFHQASDKPWNIVSLEKMPRPVKLVTSLLLAYARPVRTNTVFWEKKWHHTIITYRKTKFQLLPLFSSLIMDGNYSTVSVTQSVWCNNAFV